MTAFRNDYESKAQSYFDYERSEMLLMIPNQGRRVLGVGCGAGRLDSW
jgi:hypothetical protein